MKTFFKDYTPASLPNADGDTDFRELMCTRHEKFRVTAEYLEAQETIMGILKRLEKLLPEEGRTLGKLEDAIFTKEHMCYAAGYSDGMTDLMTAMTFNKLGLTKVEYFDLSKGA